MYLSRDDLKDILEFLNNFPSNEVVEVNSDSSSGIGSIVTATVHNVHMNGLEDVSVTKEISGVENW